MLDIFHVVLDNNPHLRGVKEPTKRLSTITKDMFQVGKNFLSLFVFFWTGMASGVF